jgi:MinD-like ATPase involved in chromosome partitioning or flagellar assembly
MGMPGTDDAPGVIIVADEPIYTLVSSLPVDWRVQPAVDTVEQMWQGLASGRLDSGCRILVFADDTRDEVAAVAQAIDRMVQAGAHVLLIGTRPDRTAAIQDSITVHRQSTAGSFSIVAEQSIAADGAAAILVHLSGIAESTEAPTSTQSRPARPPMPGIADAEASGTAPMVNSDYPEQASLSLLKQPKLPGQTTITVTSSKGGSGKSTASILLSAAIARASTQAGRPLSVCLIDLDTRDGQVASMIGQFMPTALNIRIQPIWDEERIRRNLVAAPALGIETLLAPIRPRTAQTVGPEFYRTIVRSLQRMFDVVIMDTSVQYLDPLIAEVALVEADEILFVTNLAATAVQGMARALREITAPIDESGLGIPREKIGIIVNQSIANVGMERDQVLAAGLGVPVVGVIPLATKDVLAATNLNRMHELLDHPTIGPAYAELAMACLPQRGLKPWPIPER